MIKSKHTDTDEKWLHQARAGVAITEIGGLILGEIFRQSDERIELRIIANTVARSIRTTSSIVLLSDNQDVQSAWVLHRTLVERLFHLAHLAETKSYSSFEEWSFFEQVKRQKKPLNDSLFRHRATGPEHQLTNEQKLRFKEMLKQPPVWRRPQPEEVAKRMKLKFIYDYAYDYASMLIHPMANDGEMDLMATQSGDAYRQNKQLVLNNSLIVMTLILQEAMNSPLLNWCRVAYDMVEAARAYINDPTADYKTPQQKSLALKEIDGLSGFPDS